MVDSEFFFHNIRAADAMCRVSLHMFSERSVEQPLTFGHSGRCPLCVDRGRGRCHLTKDIRVLIALWSSRKVVDDHTEVLVLLGCVTFGV